MPNYVILSEVLRRSLPLSKAKGLRINSESRAKNVILTMKLKKAKTRALVLLSGGLDSILAVKLLQKQGIEVTGLSFVSYFFNAQLAKKAAKNLDIKLKVVDFSEEHLAMVKKPKYGYGQAMNPCLDCHILMLRWAAKLAFSRAALGLPCFARAALGQPLNLLIATGEVLGERPMSQNKQALKLVEKKSGLEGYLLRPLSAKLLEPTIPEKIGLVNREKLLDISGRSRKKQIALAKKWGIKEYPTPAGGCLLTDPQFGQRLKELFQKWPDCQGQDIQLLKLGRHFWVNKTKIVVGRNDQENKTLKKLVYPPKFSKRKLGRAGKKDILMELADYPGPTTLIRGSNISQKAIKKAKSLTIYYSKVRGQKRTKVKTLTNLEKGV